MFNNYNNLKFIIALFVMLGLVLACGSKKETSKEDTKKEDTKKEETTTKEETKKETSGARLYFCEEYRDGDEIGVSDVFIISPNGGYFTCMIDLRPTDKKVGVGKVELRITKLTDDGEKIIDTKKFDVQPDWDYIFFDKFYTFRSDGKYKITAMKPDGTPIATGEVRIKYR